WSLGLEGSPRNGRARRTPGGTGIHSARRQHQGKCHRRRSALRRREGHRLDGADQARDQACIGMIRARVVHGEHATVLTDDETKPDPPLEARAPGEARFVAHPKVLVVASQGALHALDSESPAHRRKAQANVRSAGSMRACVRGGRATAKTAARVRASEPGGHATARTAGRARGFHRSERPETDPSVALADSAQSKATPALAGSARPRTSTARTESAGTALADSAQPEGVGSGAVL